MVFQNIKPSLKSKTKTKKQHSLQFHSVCPNSDSVQVQILNTASQVCDVENLISYYLKSLANSVKIAAIHFSSKNASCKHLS